MMAEMNCYRALKNAFPFPRHSKLTDHLLLGCLSGYFVHMFSLTPQTPLPDRSSYPIYANWSRFLICSAFLNIQLVYRPLEGHYGASSSVTWIHFRTFCQSVLSYSKAIVDALDPRGINELEHLLFPAPLNPQVAHPCIVVSPPQCRARWIYQHQQL